MAVQVTSPLGLLESQELVFLKDGLEATTEQRIPLSAITRQVSAAFASALAKAKELKALEEHTSGTSSSDSYRAKDWMQDPGEKSSKTTERSKQAGDAADTLEPSVSSSARQPGPARQTGCSRHNRTSPFERAISGSSWVPETPGAAARIPPAAAATPLPEPQLPTTHVCPDGTAVTIKPVLWRHFEEPHRLMVNVGLRLQPAETNDACSLSFYNTLNPRIVTTGVPARRHHPYGRSRDDSGPMHAGGKELRSSTGRQASGSLASASSGKLEKEAFRVLEVQLMKRAVPGHEVVDSWRSHSPVEGTTLMETPVWPGKWAIDVKVKVAGPDGDEFWVAAYKREVTETELDSGSASAGAAEAAE